MFWTKIYAYLHLEGFCEANSPIKPVTPKKNPVHIPAPISEIHIRLLSNIICVIMAITAQTSWTMLISLIAFFDTNFFILAVSDWGWGVFKIIGLFGNIMLI